MTRCVSPCQPADLRIPPRQSSPALRSGATYARDHIFVRQPTSNCREVAVAIDVRELTTRHLAPEFEEDCTRFEAGLADYLDGRLEEDAFRVFRLGYLTAV